MSPSEVPSREKRKQASRRRRVRRRPRRRECLLKGCEQRFRPEHPLERYCSDACRAAARAWQQWKARLKYRRSEGGKKKRKVQSQRYRDRNTQKLAESVQNVEKPARGSSEATFFRWKLRPSRLLRNLPTKQALADATVLRRSVSARPGACFGARATLEEKRPT
jgi:hypothetical protein